MQTKLNFSINWDLIKRGQLIAEINQLTNKVKNQNLSLRAFRGWRTKRVKNNVNKINLQIK